MEENTTIINETEENTTADTGDGEGRSRRKGRIKLIAAFAAGFAACLAVFAIALYPAGLGKIISQDDYDYYE